MRAVLEALALGPLIGTLIWMVTIWDRIPTRLPHHFNGAGEPDAWGDSGILLLELGMTIALYIAFGFLERVPHRVNLPFRRSPDQENELRPLGIQMIRVLKVVLVWFLLYLAVFTVLIGQGRREGLGAATAPVLLVLVFGVITFYMIRMRRRIRR